MDSEDAIVPMCLYSSQTSSFIGFPSKIRKSNKTILQCLPEGGPSSNSDKKFITQFYVINPDVHPVPSGADLICIETTNDTATDIKQLYDPFNIEEKCIRFIVWMEPTPYTTPLYFMKNDNELFISFDYNPPTSDYKPAAISTLYVLINPKENVYRIPAPQHPENTGNKTTFSFTDDGEPFFTFSGYKGRCIPDPNGKHLGECLVLVDKDVLSLNKIGMENGILSYLQDRYGKKQSFPFSLLICISILIGLILSVFWNRRK